METHTIPLRFRDADIGKLDASFRMVKAYAKEIRERVQAGEGLVLLGPPGIGKTYATAALTKVFNEVIGRGGMEFVTAPILFDRLGVFESNDDELDVYRGQSWLKTYTTVRWLVVNDLEKEYRGGKLDQQVPFKLGRVLRARSELMLPTFVTSNLTPKRMEEVYGESLVSLVAEMAKVFAVTGKDRRRAS